MVERELPKLLMRVRFPLPAPQQKYPAKSMYCIAF